ncbi:unnamed protein product [Amoebophrya sp. A25]|nr:unnamed protein product [Amoebophrya sp. A25]|eukprot:GSA25T00025993001.1
MLVCRMLTEALRVITLAARFPHWHIGSPWDQGGRLLDDTEDLKLNQEYIVVDRQLWKRELDAYHTNKFPVYNLQVWRATVPLDKTNHLQLINYIHDVPLLQAPPTTTRCPSLPHRLWAMVFAYLHPDWERMGDEDLMILNAAQLLVGYLVAHQYEGDTLRSVANNFLAQLLLIRTYVLQHPPLTRTVAKLAPLLIQPEIGSRIFRQTFGDFSLVTQPRKRAQITNYYPSGFLGTSADTPLIDALLETKAKIVTRRFYEVESCYGREYAPETRFVLQGHRLTIKERPRHKLACQCGRILYGVTKAKFAHTGVSPTQARSKHSTTWHFDFNQIYHISSSFEIANHPRQSQACTWCRVGNNYLDNKEQIITRARYIDDEVYTTEMNYRPITSPFLSLAPETRGRWTRDSVTIL